MSDLTVKGKLVKKLALEKGTSKAGKDWEKQSFVIDTGSQYNPEICFSCFGDKVKLLNKVKDQQDLSVSFNVSSREYNGKYYHNLDAWKIEVIESSEVNTTPADLSPSDTESDGLPF